MTELQKVKAELIKAKVQIHNLQQAISKERIELQMKSFELSLKLKKDQKFNWDNLLIEKQVNN